MEIDKEKALQTVKSGLSGAVSDFKKLIFGDKIFAALTALAVLGCAVTCVFGGGVSMGGAAGECVTPGGNWEEGSKGEFHNLKEGYKFISRLAVTSQVLGKRNEFFRDAINCESVAALKAKMKEISKETGFESFAFTAEYKIIKPSVLGDKTIDKVDLVAGNRLFKDLSSANKALDKALAKTNARIKGLK